MEAPVAGTTIPLTLKSHHGDVGRVKQGRHPGVFAQIDKGEIFVLRALHESMGIDTRVWG